jgi:imidazolonepropionase-like amidohydrolase
MTEKSSAASRPQLFTNVRIFDGTGTAPVPGEVLVEGNRIRAVATKGNTIQREGHDIVDGGGNTLMPGLTEAHAHVTYTNMVRLKEMGQIPPEEHMLIAAENAKLLLDSGFTSIYSAASSKPRTEIVLRNFINSGRLPGPRMKAACPEIVATGGLGDENQLHMAHQGIEIVCDGVEPIRKLVRTMIREGVDVIKLNISGDNFVRPGFGRQCSYTDAEVGAAAEEAHSRGAWLSCHARADGAVKMALKHRFRVIYHCDFIEGETFDLLEAAKDRVFLAPAIGIIYTTAYEAQAWGITPEIAASMEQQSMVEGCTRVYGELFKRGLRILPGGDYGFAWNPMGRNARDLEHFVNIIGLTPAQALMTATQWGGQIMGMGGELGLIKEGFLADLLIVEGDPTQDIRLMQDRDKLLVIMKDGVYHKSPDAVQRQASGSKPGSMRAVWDLVGTSL